MISPPSGPGRFFACVSGVLGRALGVVREDFVLGQGDVLAAVGLPAWGGGEHWILWCWAVGAPQPAAQDVLPVGEEVSLGFLARRIALPGGPGDCPAEVIAAPIGISAGTRALLVGGEEVRLFRHPQRLATAAQRARHQRAANELAAASTQPLPPPPSRAAELSEVERPGFAPWRRGAAPFPRGGGRF